jgi:hypothetical protein
VSQHDDLENPDLENPETFLARQLGVFGFLRLSVADSLTFFVPRSHLAERRTAAVAVVAVPAAASVPG